MIRGIQRLLGAALIGGSAVLATSAMAGDIGTGAVDFSKLGDGSYKRVVEGGITFGISNDPPFTYQDDKTKEYDGMDVRIMKEAAKRLGINNVKWELVQFDALIPGLVAGRWDVVVDNLHENPKRLEVISFTGPSFWYGSAIAVQKGNPKNIHTWEDLAGKTVGTIRGSIGQGILEARGDLQEVKLYTSNEAEFADVIAGRLDAVMEDGLKIGQFLKKNPDVALEMAAGYSPPADEYGYARYGIRKDDVDLNLAISRALAEIRADGTLSSIVKEYGFTDRNLWFFPTQ
jgi:polar amino acid transport system substrate-binding protein